MVCALMGEPGRTEARPPEGMGFCWHPVAQAPVQRQQEIA